MTTVLNRPRRADSKNSVKNYQLLPEKMRFENTKISPIYFFKFKWDYELNLSRYLNPKLPPMHDFVSLYSASIALLYVEVRSGG